MSTGSRQDPATERAHFEAVVAARGTLYWSERTEAGRRRREIRSALLMQAAQGTGGGRARVLEVGCGIGDYTRELATHARGLLVGFDITPGLVSLARGQVPASAALMASDAEVLPFATGTFDAVVGNAVLHHLRLDQALPELLRVLRPGGRFCFAEPNMLNPQVFLERNVAWIGRRMDNSPGETAFVRWSLRRQLAGAGLSDIRVRPFDFLYPMTPPSWIATVERLGHLLERTPMLAEIAGSLLITARKD